MGKSLRRSVTADDGDVIRLAVDLAVIAIDAGTEQEVGTMGDVGGRGAGADILAEVIDGLAVHAGVAERTLGFVEGGAGDRDQGGGGGIFLVFLEVVRGGDAGIETGELGGTVG